MITKAINRPLVFPISTKKKFLRRSNNIKQFDSMNNIVPIVMDFNIIDDHVKDLFSKANGYNNFDIFLENLNTEQIPESIQNMIKLSKCIKKCNDGKTYHNCHILCYEEFENLAFSIFN